MTTYSFVKAGDDATAQRFDKHAVARSAAIKASLHPDLRNAVVVLVRVVDGDIESKTSYKNGREVAR